MLQMKKFKGNYRNKKCKTKNENTIKVPRVKNYYVKNSKECVLEKSLKLFKR